MRTLLAKSLAVALAPLGACASYAPPMEHLASSVAAVRGAQEAGASGSPQASLHLRLAQEEVAKAKALLDNGKNENADYMTMRASADAELAIALAREETARARAQQSAAKVPSGAPSTTPATSQ